MNAELFTADFRAGQKVRKSQVAGLPDPEHWVRAYLLNKGLSPGDPGSGVRVTGARLWMRRDTPDPSMPALPFRGPSASGVTTATAMLLEEGPVENEGGWGVSIGSSTSSRHVCIRKSVSPPLTQGGLFGGYVTRNVQVRQTSSSVNAFYEEYIYVTVGSTAQVRGVLLEENTDDIELGTGYEERLERFQLNPL